MRSNPVKAAVGLLLALLTLPRASAFIPGQIWDTVGRGLQLINPAGFYAPGSNAALAVDAILLFMVLYMPVHELGKKQEHLMWPARAVGLAIWVGGVLWMQRMGFAILSEPYTVLLAIAVFIITMWRLFQGAYEDWIGGKSNWGKAAAFLIAVSIGCALGAQFLPVTVAAGGSGEQAANAAAVLGFGASLGSLGWIIVLFGLVGAVGRAGGPAGTRVGSRRGVRGAQQEEGLMRKLGKKFLDARSKRKEEHERHEQHVSRLERHLEDLEVNEIQADQTAKQQLAQIKTAIEQLSTRTQALAKNLEQYRDWLDGASDRTLPDEYRSRLAQIAEQFKNYIGGVAEQLSAYRDALAQRREEHQKDWAQRLLDEYRSIEKDYEELLEQTERIGEVLKDTTKTFRHLSEEYTAEKDLTGLEKQLVNINELANLHKIAYEKAKGLISTRAEREGRIAQFKKEINAIHEHAQLAHKQEQAVRKSLKASQEFARALAEKLQAASNHAQTALDNIDPEALETVQKALADAEKQAIEEDNRIDTRTQDEQQAAKALNTIQERLPDTKEQYEQLFNDVNKTLVEGDVIALFDDVFEHIFAAAKQAQAAIANEDDKEKAKQKARDLIAKHVKQIRKLTKRPQQGTEQYATRIQRSLKAFVKNAKTVLDDAIHIVNESGEPLEVESDEETEQQFDEIVHENYTE